MLVVVGLNRVMLLGRIDFSCQKNDQSNLRRHFESTQHTYTMDLKRQHVWDYVGDNYVHRLIQNKGDGKLVELRGEGVINYDIVRAFVLNFTSSFH